MNVLKECSTLQQKIKLLKHPIFLFQAVLGSLNPSINCDHLTKTRLQCARPMY